ncbi:hypothetical protein LPY66_16015 [Dehalobacter sp. DCM]|uniref:hypothetical protein n=1 Tax=Dehalobacter sp. DCM TaxID=2907827 RepID=UPI003081AB0D|nr:hypothetical protein LPY66_16015 [Dehalobacter sp. DCM]
MPFFTQKLFLKKPTETEQVDFKDYNDNLDTIDSAIQEHVTEKMAHAEFLSLYKLNKDAFSVFTEIQWKRKNGTLAKRSVLSGGTPPNYLNKTETYYGDDGITVKATKTYVLTYDQDNELISEVLQ